MPTKLSRRGGAVDPFIVMDVGAGKSIDFIGLYVRQNARKCTGMKPVHPQNPPQQDLGGAC